MPVPGFARDEDVARGPFHGVEGAAEAGVDLDLRFRLRLFSHDPRFGHSRLLSEVLVLEKRRSANAMGLIQ
ncbi:MAG: hypothetical protein M0C28_03980 [Candidatus Moduliflexus flocculans]|nr:hypothetical protein [Candidatus Moduliflexus flocculans]